MPIYPDKRAYERVMLTMQYYHFTKLPVKLSRLLVLSNNLRQQIISDLKKKGNKLVEILTFCFMPNHFHFLLEQKRVNGITTFLSNFTNSYTKYFNTREERLGPIFEGTFKAVIVETDEQLVHLSRYIHLNPVSSLLVKSENLEKYPWSSLPEYFNHTSEPICDKQKVLGFFPTVDKYRKFLYDQISYAQELERIKHLLME